jgi:hypothetical protein
MPDVTEQTLFALPEIAPPAPPPKSPPPPKAVAAAAPGPKAVVAAARPPVEAAPKAKGKKRAESDESDDPAEKKPRDERVLTGTWGRVAGLTQHLVGQETDHLERDINGKTCQLPRPALITVCGLQFHRKLWTDRPRPNTLRCSACTANAKAPA